MLNLAGHEYDFGPVLFTVLQECEHRRRGLPADLSDSAGSAESEARLTEIARAKLAEIEVCHREAGGTPAYWRELKTEVLETALPQYTRAAVAQASLEAASYGIWRQGDPLARALFGLGGLAAGGLIVKIPFIPIFEDTFAFALAAAAFFYPELRRAYFDWRYARLLNRLVVQAESYQHRQLPYVSEASLAAELDAVEATTTAAPHRAEAAATPAAVPSAETSAGATPDVVLPARAGRQAAASRTPPGPAA